MLTRQELQEKARVLELKRGELAKLFSDNKKDGELVLNTGQIKEINDREIELKKLTDEFAPEWAEFKQLEHIEDENQKALEALGRPIGNPLPFDGKGANPSARFLEAKSLGQCFVESKNYKTALHEKFPEANEKVKAFQVEGVDVKTVMATNTSLTGGGYPPQVLRSGVVVFSPQPQPTLIDLVPQTNTTQNAYKYMLESVFTNAAVETAEGALAGEAQLTFTEELSPIIKIPVYIPITEEELADVDGIRDIVDQRLVLMIKQRLNLQIVVGNGTSPNLTGITNTANVLGHATGGDNNADALYKAMVQIMTTGFCEPSGIWLNPLNWQTIRLMKSSTGQYLYGDPSQPGPTSVFGLPVAQHVNVPQGDAVVADFAAYTKLVYRNGIEFAVSNSHLDYFTRGQLAIRAMIRVGLVVYRPQAVSIVTGLS